VKIQDTQAHEAKPFLGKRLVLTRAAADNARWAPALEALGAEVLSLICIESHTTGDAGELRQALKGADWLVLGSRRAAEAAEELLLKRGAAPQPRLACVGPATAAAAEALFGPAALLPEGGTMAALARDLRERLHRSPPQTILELAAEDGRHDLAEGLAGTPHELRRLVVYRTAPAAGVERPPALFEIAGGPVDLVLLASPSALTGLRHLASVPEGLPCVALGPTTHAAALAAGFAPCTEAATRDLDGLIAAARQALSASPGSAS